MMTRFGTIKLAVAALLATALTGCCCIGGGHRTSTQGVNGPTLRAGFVRISKNMSTNVVAYYSNDKNNVAIQYWATAPGGLPIQAMVGDTLTYEFINQPLAQSAADMCNNPAVRATFPDDCEVTPVTLTQAAPTTCPPMQMMQLAK